MKKFWLRALVLSALLLTGCGRGARNVDTSEAPEDQATRLGHAQQALVRVFLRAAEFDASRPALPWVLGVVANECRTLRRKAQRRREGPLEEADARPDPGASPEESATGRDLERAALAALDGLPAPDVEAILAHIGAAGRPDLPPATFRKRLERALKRLRRAWSERHGTL